jgi:hypothetical protein
MPSGKFAPGTTWRPIEEATTPWVPNLKLPATELSKNISTLTINIASNSNTNRFDALAQIVLQLQPSVTNEFSNRTPYLKTLPLVLPIAILLTWFRL